MSNSQGNVNLQISALLEQVKQVEFFGPAMFLNTTTEDVVFKNI